MTGQVDDMAAWLGRYLYDVASKRFVAMIDYRIDCLAGIGIGKSIDKWIEISSQLTAGLDFVMRALPLELIVSQLLILL